MEPPIQHVQGVPHVKEHMVTAPYHNRQFYTKIPSSSLVDSASLKDKFLTSLGFSQRMSDSRENQSVWANLS